MKFTEKEIRLKDGRIAILRAPLPSDGAETAAFMRQTYGETSYLLLTPNEFRFTPEQEATFLQNSLDSETEMMILCTVGGKIAGNCNLRRNKRLKNHHRGSIGITLLKEYWGLGIGTALLTELIQTAKAWGLEQLELRVMEGNERAIGLYKKMGFVTCGAIPNSFRLSDGTMQKEIIMYCPIL